ncbi:Transcription factor TFIIIB component B [Apophysomyces sp. BC1015]|nr:Transcription factor TFIIIB component B [Apophysomyces sp. BC1015]
MSSLTSLSVNKNSTRFAPKVKARPARRPAAAQQQQQQQQTNAGTSSESTAEITSDNVNNDKPTAIKSNVIPPTIESTARTAPPVSTVFTAPTVSSAPAVSAGSSLNESSVVKPPAIQASTRSPGSSVDSGILPRETTPAENTEVKSGGPACAFAAEESAYDQREGTPIKRETRETSEEAAQPAKKTKRKADSGDSAAASHKKAGATISTTRTNKKKINNDTASSKPATSKTTKSKSTTKKSTTSKSTTQGEATTAAVTATSSRKSKGKGIAIGVPSRSEDSTNATATERRPSSPSAIRKPKKHKYDIDPSELLTIDDIDYDPANTDHLEKPVSYFTKDFMTGIVSKAFKEYEVDRVRKKKKQEEQDKLPLEEREVFRRHEEEKAEREKKEMTAKEEERKKRMQENVVLEETSLAPQVRIVNGEIVLDTDSLVIDRNASQANYSHEDMEVVEENSMTRKVNSMTYGKKVSSSRWSSEETDLFYDALSQFGTDFEMVSHLLPGRTRNQVRLKFNREERAHPDKVTDYLLRRKKPVDIKTYQAAIGYEFEEVPEDFHSRQLS